MNGQWDFAKKRENHDSNFIHDNKIGEGGGSETCDFFVLTLTG